MLVRHVTKVLWWPFCPPRHHQISSVGVWFVNTCPALFSHWFKWWCDRQPSLQACALSPTEPSMKVVTQSYTRVAYVCRQGEPIRGIWRENSATCDVSARLTGDIRQNVGDKNSSFIAGYHLEYGVIVMMVLRSIVFVYMSVTGEFRRREKQ